MGKPVASMTGFARAEANHGDWRIVWELRSVNGKSLDVRLRLPAGLESLELDARRKPAASLTRGNIQMSLQLQRGAVAPQRAINRQALMAYVAEARWLVTEGHASPPTADGLLALKGVLDATPDEAPEAEAELASAALETLDNALQALAAARAAEGAEIAGVLLRRLDEMGALAAAAEADPARTPDAIRARLRSQVEVLLAATATVDEGRLAQEAALLATRADIREELDRLNAHIAAARALLSEGGAIGRRLDFLSQEFNRESNTLCAKSNAASLTAIGLQLKVVVDQFKEQVQNIE
ncbi:TIGR00255 family protein [Aureimonas altamirensis DSM 21988]|uniref:TIGR00255 family protein n=1 Tax=Aureimonas altamirensis DSM 21988 TaxID=1121026 RepID=A0ABY1I683_9HYPH|nr:YicC/YloC family endoribonuclease [Aureimonas altamirensis]SHI68336.1 TIGR00255 family protein [Aureimonas altamirensis DSM 21988]